MWAFRNCQLEGGGTIKADGTCEHVSGINHLLKVFLLYQLQGVEAGIVLKRQQMSFFFFSITSSRSIELLS